MKQKDKFRFAEKCLYEYKKNIACLDILRDDLKVEKSGTAVHAQNYQLSFNFTGEPSDPVQARLLKIGALEDKIRRLERYTKPITQLIKDLDTSEALDESDNKILLEILRFMYFAKNKPKIIREKLILSERTFSIRRCELVRLAGDYLCL